MNSTKKQKQTNPIENAAYSEAVKKGH